MMYHYYPIQYILGQRKIAECTEYATIGAIVMVLGNYNRTKYDPDRRAENLKTTVPIW